MATSQLLLHKHTEECIQAELSLELWNLKTLGHCFQSACSTKAFRIHVIVKSRLFHHTTVKEYTLHRQDNSRSL